MTGHALLSPSSAERWMTCPGSVLATKDLPDRSSADADAGTCAHEVAALCLLKNQHAEAYLGATFAGVTVDAEMVEAVQFYLDYVRGIEGALQVEQRVHFDRWVPEGSGTSDAIVLNSPIMHVIDLKFGKGIRVDAEQNKQLMLYALGALDQYGDLYDVQEVVLHIVQPRLDAISSWQVSAADLLKFAEEAQAAAAIALHPERYPELRKFQPSEKGCQWCKIRATCKARAELAVETAVTVDFADDLTPVPQPKPCATLDPAEIAQLLPLAPLVKAWANDLEAHALALALSGTEVPGFKIVEGRSNRKWSADEETVAAVLELHDVDPWRQSLITITDAEKAIGKKKAAEALGQLISKPEGKPALVPLSDKRPAFTPSTTADADFSDDLETE